MTGNRFYDKIHNWLLPVPEQQCDVFPPLHHYQTPFQKLILDYLAWNGINKKGNVTSNKVYPTRMEILEAKSTLRKCGFSTGVYLEKLVVSEFLEMKRNIPDLDSETFIPVFEDSFHNLKLTQFATLEAQKSNKILKEYYDTIKMFLIEIQACLKIKYLRTRIECNFSEIGSWNNPTRVEEFVTPFAKVGLNCHKSAKFSINYFINPHLKELIGESLGDTLEKQFNEFITGEMKDLIKLIPLNRRYDRYFEELLRFSRTHPNYKAFITDKNSL
ncbi:hypothetical protein SAMN05421786_104134 [Chryseobacterium ureilyticum]|uniref:Uncharacterized protein n=1 Tax=Chryseobacterium ureilyticum TaxID=373668 RepID=A0A1N7NWS0_9FLAO|nr:hypothetical protein [Chryseobacterium ureilyticum]SIT02738.1 hypothetical protein SAMN05421786_104134 [Chryseobacterium ureilyticum]